MTRPSTQANGFEDTDKILFFCLEGAYVLSLCLQVIAIAMLEILAANMSKTLVS
jgi:hypothetical protein